MLPIRKIGKASNFVLLPSKTTSTEMPGHDGEAILRGEGFRFYEPCADFPSLRPTEIPAGWIISELASNKKDQQGNITRYTLQDEDGRLRARIRVKEYWHIGIAPRVVRADTEMDVISAFRICRIREKGKIGASLKLHKKQIFSHPLVPTAELDTEEYWNELKAALLKMLDETYPDWKKSAAYWQSKQKQVWAQVGTL